MEPGTGKRRPAAVAALLLLFALQGAWAIARQSPVFDEAAHLPAGLEALASGRFDLYANNPPLAKLLAALPARALDPRLPAREGKSHWRYAHDFQLLNADRYHLIFAAGRTAILALGVLLGLLVFRWARTLGGEAAGLAALAVYACSPTLVANAALVTPDLCATLFIFLTVVAFHRYAVRPSAAGVAATGCALGLALLSKFTALALLPVLLLLALAPSGASSRGERLRALLAALALALAVLDAGYLFRGVLIPLGSLGPASPLLASLPPWLRLPLPADWVRGLDAQLASNAEPFPAYFFGKVYQDGGRLWYYDVTLLLCKVTLPAAALCAVGLVTLARGAREGCWWLLIPVAVLAALVSVLVHQKIGLRYLLPAVPFLVVVAGLGGGRLARGGRAGRAVLALALAAHGVAALRVGPDYLSHFNVLAGGSRGAYRSFVDSGLDWGQSLIALRDALRERGIARVKLSYFGTVEPALYGIVREPIVESVPAPGWYAVSATHLAGVYDRRRFPLQNVFGSAADLGWLRSRAPEAVVGNSILLYRVGAGGGPGTGSSSAESPAGVHQGRSTK